MTEVAVIIPIYKTDLSDEEHLSLKLAKQHFLDKTVFIVAPNKLKNDHRFNEIVKKYNFKQHFFDDKYFKNIPGYNRLMLNINFYKAFESFRYILMHWFFREICHIGQVKTMII